MGVACTQALPDQDAVLSSYALRSIVTPANVSVDAQGTKVKRGPSTVTYTLTAPALRAWRSRVHVRSSRAATQALTMHRPRP